MNRGDEDEMGSKILIVAVDERIKSKLALQSSSCQALRFSSSQLNIKQSSTQAATATVRAPAADSERPSSSFEVKDLGSTAAKVASMESKLQSVAVRLGDADVQLDIWKRVLIALWVGSSSTRRNKESEGRSKCSEAACYQPPSSPPCAHAWQRGDKPPATACRKDPSVTKMNSYLEVSRSIPMSYDHARTKLESLFLENLYN
eukprot:753857-Hanusia_phi.AAC.2